MQHGLAAANVARQNARKLATEHELAAARIDLDGLKIRELVLEQIRDKIVIAEERVASAEAGIERSLVRAPADGRIVEYLCTLGSDVRRGETLLAVQPDKEVWLEAWATGKEAKDLHVGDEVDIELVDLVCIIQNGNISFEKIDEYPLARLEHCAKCWIRRASLERNWGVLHGGYLAI